MLSKEEIEVLKQLFREVIQTKEKSDIRLKINKEVAKYLLNCINERDQLESDKQKLIEKLEKEEICCRQTENRIKNIVQEEAKRQVEAYKQHVLKILKGENHE